MKDNIQRLYKDGYLSEMDIHFARFITRIHGREEREVFLGAALLTGLSQGVISACRFLRFPIPCSRAEKVVRPLFNAPHFPPGRTNCWKAGQWDGRVILLH